MKRIENELLKKQRDRSERERKRENSPKSPKYLVSTLTGNKQALCKIVKNVTFICATRRNESRAAGGGSSEQNPFPPQSEGIESGPAATRCVGVMLPRRCRIANRCLLFEKSELHPREEDVHLFLFTDCYYIIVCLHLFQRYLEI